MDADRTISEQLADFEDYREHWGPLAEALKRAWREEKWDLDGDALGELAWEAIHVIDKWLDQGERITHIPLVMFRNEIALRNRWKQRALDLGYQPEALRE